MNNKTGFLSAALAAMAILMLVPATASAQGYGGGGGGYGPAPSGAPGTWGFVQRRGLTLGAGLGVGGMSSADESLTSCFDCNYSPVAGGVDFHIGAMLNPRLALVFDVFVPFQVIDDEFATYLVQPMFTGAIKYWVAPQFYLRGGLGVASLQVSFNDGGPNEELDTGGAGHIGAGFEFLQAPRFTADLNVRLTSATYEGLDNQVSTATVGVSANWF